MKTGNPQRTLPSHSYYVWAFDFASQGIWTKTKPAGMSSPVLIKKRFLTRRVRVADSEPVNSGVGLRYLTLS